MNHTAGNSFFTKLPLVSDTLESIMANPRIFTALPDDWFVVVTDIKNSSEATLSGQAHAVNTIAAASLVSMLNLGFDAKIDLPYTFGGDGVTVAIPGSLKAAAMQTIARLANHAQQAYDLTLRVGAVSSITLNEHHHPVAIVKQRTGNNGHHAIFAGGGIAYAEHLVKSDENYQYNTKLDHHAIPIEGLTCNFETLEAPKNRHQILSLIVVPLVNPPHSTFEKVLAAIVGTYGSYTDRHPIMSKAISRHTKLNNPQEESILKYGYIKTSYVIKRVLAHLGRKLRPRKRILTKDNQGHIKIITDSLVIDGNLKTVIAGNDTLKQQLLKKLQALEDQGVLLYGYNVSDQVIMTCTIRHKGKSVMNFIDGNHAGYTKAATQIKQKRAAKKL